MRIISQIKELLRTNTFTRPIYFSLGKIKSNRQKQQKRKSIQRQGFILLDQIHHSFEAAGIAYFIDFGTLLGMIREGGFIGHDLDIDIGVITNQPASDHQIVRDLLMKKGMKWKCEYVFQDRVVEDSFEFCGIKFDVNYYLNDDEFSRCWLFYSLGNVQYPCMNVVELKYSRIAVTEIRAFHGVSMRVPSNAEGVLEEKYGKNWRTPDPGWIYWKAPSAIASKENGYCIDHSR